MAPVVLVTGTSTGVGAACVERLARSGWTVLAGVRRVVDGDALRERVDGDVRPLPLDVTDPAAVERAAALVDEVCGAGGLRGLVNNAGVATAGPFELTSLAEWRTQLEVNLLGAVAVTQASLPAVRRAGGRIVFVGSQMGRISLPGSSAYAASKHAVEAVTEALHHELAASPVRVAVVEPGQVRTPLFGKLAAEASGREVRAVGRQRPEDAHLAAATRAYIRGGQAMGMRPARVARSVEHALSAAHPRRRYLVGADARMLAGVIARLPDPLRDRAVEGVIAGYARAGRRLRL
jgi:NAD(P)-dependent dehydrogenase (short-subunit alcohol dehydrogenase family)